MASPPCRARCGQSAHLRYRCGLTVVRYELLAAALSLNLVMKLGNCGVSVNCSWCATPRTSRRSCVSIALTLRVGPCVCISIAEYCTCARAATAQFKTYTDIPSDSTFHQIQRGTLGTTGGRKLFATKTGRKTYRRKKQWWEEERRRAQDLLLSFYMSFIFYV